MTSVFVIGHGGYWEGTDDEGPTGMWTRVPTGTTMHFYAEPDHGLLPMNALEILRNNGAGGAIESKGEGERIPNYCFSPLEDDAWMQILGGVQPGQDVRFIGRDGLTADRLCLTFGACTKDSHTCGGLFQVLAGVTHLHVLSCRVGPLEPGADVAEAAASGEYPNTEHIPGEHPDNPAHYQRIEKLAGDILTHAQYNNDTEQILDPENADAGALFDSLDNVDQVKLMAVQQVRKWSHVRYARLLLKHHQASSDLPGFQAWASTAAAIRVVTCG